VQNGLEEAHTTKTIWAIKSQGIADTAGFISSNSAQS
jgi:hypothetical protein